MFLFNSLSLSTPASSLRKIATADPCDENEASDKEGGEVEVARMWLVGPQAVMLRVEMSLVESTCFPIFSL